MEHDLLIVTTAILMAGSSPDQVHVVHVSRFMDMAEAIMKEADKRMKEPPEPSKQQEA